MHPGGAAPSAVRDSRRTGNEAMMLIKKPADILSSEITSESLYLNRRKFILGASAAGAALATGVAVRELSSPAAAAASQKLPFSKSQFSTSEKLTPYKYITNYN